MHRIRHTPDPAITSGTPTHRNASGRLTVSWLFVWLILVTGCGEKKPASEARIDRPRDSGGWQTRDWPMTRGGKALQGRVHDRVPRQPVVDWTFSVKGAVTSEAALSNGMIVFGCDDGAVVSVDMATRKERWRIVTKDTVEATPAIASGRVFAGSNDGAFRAINLETGKEVWTIHGQEKFPTGGVVVASPDGLDEWILVNGYDGVSRCLRTSDGMQVWRHDSQNYINGSPAILDGDRVAFGGCDSVIHVINLRDGCAMSEVTTDAQIIRSLATWDRTVYAVNYANQLVALEVTAAKPTWVFENNGSQLLSCPAVDDARVYVGSRDHHVHAVNRLSGKQEWQFKTGGRVESSPLVFDDAVVFGSSDGRLYAVDKQDGHQIWRLDLGENLAVAPSFASGAIVIGGGDGTLFVIRGGDHP